MIAKGCAGDGALGLARGGDLPTFEVMELPRASCTLMAGVSRSCVLAGGIRSQFVDWQKITIL